MSDELDQLLNEYKEGASAAPVAPAAPASPVAPLMEAIKPVAEFARRKMMEEQQAEVAKGVSEAVAAVKKTDGLDGVPDRIITGLLHAAYADDPQFRAAYDNRQANPAALQAKLTEMGASLSEDVKGFTVSAARSDIEAAKAAVRGAGQKSEQKEAVNPVSLFEMSDVEFRNYKSKLTSVN